MSKAEKFIQLNTKKYSNETRLTIGRHSHWEKQPWLTPEQALAAVEIAREELIDKACEWLKEHWREYVWLTDNDIIHFGHYEKDFKKAMEE